MSTVAKKERLDHTQKTLSTFILDEQKNNVCNSCSDEPKFPPGFTPDNNDREKNVEENIKDTTERVQSLSNKLNDRCSNRGFSLQRSMNSHSQKSKALETRLNRDRLRSYVRSIELILPLFKKLKRRVLVYTPLRICGEIRCLTMWEGDTMIMGDFNEVCSEHERFGSTFNRQWAIAFNNFISSACLIDLHLEGYAFTWAHKSALKMTKLDRYLISEGVLDLFPHLSALCLDRHLSDHRPILLRETNYDYGPFPLLKKLQALNIAIKAWSKEANKRSNDRKINIQQNLSEVNKLIDQGKSNDEILIKRITLLDDLQELNNRNAMEISQKVKIRWSIEGDENFKYFHVQDLERTVTYEEVKRAAWDYGTNKSPGPDGFSFEFYLFIGEWNNNNIQTLLSVLRCFYLASGLKINLHKSKLMRISVSSNVVTAAASLIGCSILTAHFNYLGVNVGSNMSRITSWDDVISKVFSRLSKWKLKLLSISGRLSLVRSVLISVPLYHMSVFKVPIGVLNHLESIRRNFFYEFDGSDTKLTWIGWNMVPT
nr:RNA-directed DNA polymerase, eukaryota [Tanacetum cinerariifolium]